MSSSRSYTPRHASAGRKRRPLLKLMFWALLAFIVVVVAVVAILLWPRPGSPAAQTAPSQSPSPSASQASPSTAVSDWPVATAAPREAGVAPGDGTFLDPAGVDRTDPDAVAEATAVLLASHDALLDDSEASAKLRAKPLLDPALLEGPSAENPSPGPQWLEAQQHDAYTQPLVTPLTVPALGHAHEGESEAEHAEHEGRVGQSTELAGGEAALGYEYDVLYHWQGRDGWVSEPEAGQKRAVRLSLVERDGVWVVARAFYGSE